MDKLIRWGPAAWEVRNLAQGRTKEVKLIEYMQGGSEGGAVVKGGSEEVYGNIWNFPFLVPVTYLSDSVCGYFEVSCLMSLSAFNLVVTVAPFTLLSFPLLKLVA